MALTDEERTRPPYVWRTDRPFDIRGGRQWGHSNSDEPYVLRCHRCGSGGRATKDHIVPRAIGGSDMPWNLVPCCQPCNAEKADRWPDCTCTYCQEAIRRFLAGERVPTRDAATAFRSAWIAEQEDGTLITLHSSAFATLREAEEDWAKVRRLPYIKDAWVERSQWTRIP